MWCAIQTEDFDIKDATYYVVDAEKIYRNIWLRVGPIFVSSINESRSIESYTWSNYYSLQSFSFYPTSIIQDSYAFLFVCSRCCHHQNKIEINWEFPARNKWRTYYFRFNWSTNKDPAVTSKVRLCKQLMRHTQRRTSFEGNLYFAIDEDYNSN